MCCKETPIHKKKPPVARATTASSSHSRCENGLASVSGRKRYRVRMMEIRPMAICDRVYVIDTGQIGFAGTFEELERNPEAKRAHLMV